jgi:hypothetical protein
MTRCPPPSHHWRMAKQGYKAADFELKTQPWGDGYVMIIEMGATYRRVFFDSAGRVTHIRNNPPQLD